MDALDFLDMLDDLEIEALAELSMQEMEDGLVILNRLQLYDGKRHDGQDIFPTYYDDPYFTTRAEAMRYSDWKDRITPNTKRTQGVPNLAINGYYYSTLQVKVENNEIITTSGWDAESDILGKYSDEIYGLNEDYREKMIEDEGLAAKFEDHFTEQTGLNFT